MADFSLEYSKRHSGDFNDFSIKEEFEKLQVGYYISIICEGYGLLAIANNEGKCCVAMPIKPDDEGNDYEWRSFDFETNDIGDVVVMVES